MTRIIAGEAGSLTLEVPQGPTRPTSSRVREAIFSSLTSRMDLTNCRVLDLYAGSGALGFEALSRGASVLVAVDNDRTAHRALRHNAATIRTALGHKVHISVLCTSVRRAVSQLPSDQHFELVFIDPPYDIHDAHVAHDLDALVPHLADGALVVVERSQHATDHWWPAGFELLGQKTYGDTCVFTLSRKGSQPPELTEGADPPTVTLGPPGGHSTT